MPEPVEDAFFLEQPRDESEVTFPVLHAVIAFLEWPDRLVLEVDAAFLQYLLDDFRNAHLLEDARVHSLGEEPESGYDLQAIARERVVAAELNEASNHSVDVPVPTANEIEGQGHAGAEELLAVDGGVLR